MPKAKFRKKKSPKRVLALPHSSSTVPCTLARIADEPVNSPTTGESNDIYTECLLRTLDTNGLVMATFTPLRGRTKFTDAPDA